MSRLKIDQESFDVLNKNLSDIFQMNYNQISFDVGLLKSTNYIIPWNKGLSLHYNVWNKGLTNTDNIPGNKKAYLNGLKTRFKIGDVPWNKNIPHSEETKIKISKKASLYCWINDGFNSKQHLKNEMIPDGWNRGRLISWVTRSKKQ